MYKLMNLAKNKVLMVVIFTALFGLVAMPVLAAVDPDADVLGLQKIEDNTQLGTSDLRVTITKIINVSLSLLGIVSVVIILAGGFKWMTAGGNEEKVTEARKIIFAGIIGLAIILSAWAIASFVLENLGKATGTEGYVDAG